MIPTPLNDKVIIDPETPPDVSKGGIAIPDCAKQRSDRGTVVAVGPGAISQKTGERLPMVLKPGNTVLFPMYVGQEIKVNGKEMKVMTEDDVLAVVK
jgi:chaperonin GroES